MVKLRRGEKLGAALAVQQNKKGMFEKEKVERGVTRGERGNGKKPFGNNPRIWFVAQFEERERTRKKKRMVAGRNQRGDSLAHPEARPKGWNEEKILWGNEQRQD